MPTQTGELSVWPLHLGFPLIRPTYLEFVSCIRQYKESSNAEKCNFNK